MRPTKNADTLRVWLQKPPARAHELVLFLDGTLIETWSRDAAAAGSGAELVLASAQSHTDDIDKTSVYTAQWRDPDHVSLGSKLITCQPDEELGGGATVSQGLALAYKQQQQTQRLLQSMLEPLLKGYKDLIDAQTKENEMLRTRLLGASGLESATASPENEQVTQLKIKALSNLAELGPDIGRLALAAIGKVLQLEGATDPSTPTAPNGSTVQ